MIIIASSSDSIVSLRTPILSVAACNGDFTTVNFFVVSKQLTYLNIKLRSFS